MQINTGPSKIVINKMSSSLRRRKLLLLTYYFPPVASSAVYRWLGLSRHLVNLGWDIVVVAPDAVKWEPEDPALLNQLVPGIHVERVPFPKSIVSQVIGRKFFYEMWLAAGWKRTREVIESHQPDVVLTTSPPGSIHTLGYWVKRQYGMPWIADLRDPWFTDLKKLTEDTWYNKILNRRSEKRTMHCADLVMANTPTTLKLLQRAYPEAAGKMIMLTNGFDSVELPNAAQQQSRLPGELTLLHAGEFYAGRDPRPLFRCLVELNRTEAAKGRRFRLKLLGRTDSDFDIAEEVKSNGLADVIDVVGQVPHNVVLSSIAAADILVSIQGPGLQHCIPAKLYEYMSFAKPILQLAEPGGDIDWALQKSKVIHRVVSQFDEPGIKQAISDLAADALAQSVTKYDSSDVRVFRRTYLAERLASELDALTGHTAAASGTQ